LFPPDHQALQASFSAFLAGVGNEKRARHRPETSTGKAGAFLVPYHARCTPTTIVLGETGSIAREKTEYLTSLMPPEMVFATNSSALGADLSEDQGQQGHQRA
jgi:hypothetical protein